MRHLAIAAVILSGLAGSELQAGFQYGFEAITNRNSTNVAIGESQLHLNVESIGSNLVEFTFGNIGTQQSSITDIYFDDSGLFVPTLQAIYNGPGTQFSPDAQPGNLPEGYGVGFYATPGLTLDSDRPTVKNGANPGESVGVLLELNAGKTFTDVVDALTDLSLRVGVQMKGFAIKGRESFVNNPNSNPPVVPEPATATLAGLACLGLFMRRKKKTAE